MGREAFLSVRRSFHIKAHSSPVWGTWSWTTRGRTQAAPRKCAAKAWRSSGSHAD